jgi:hypothetical protein
MPALERKWAASYTPNPPKIRAADLVPGTHYAVLMRHASTCWLRAGWRCTCKPDIRLASCMIDLTRKKTIVDIPMTKAKYCTHASLQLPVGTPRF